uniref:Uncharacterized protein n=1 Tax=Helianthus annuus TaxID=4232 RepID=A0A251T3T3_HELAN
MRACEVQMQSAPSKRHIAPIALVPVPVPCPCPCPGPGAGACACRVLRTLLAATWCELSHKNTFV